jgi:PEP-CTERM motif
MFIKTCGLLAAITLTGTMLASAVTVLNPSFEIDGSGQYPAGWNATCGSCGTFNALVPTDFTVGIPDGTKTLYVNSTVGVHQVLSAMILPDTLYTLDVMVGHRNDTNAIFAGSDIQLRASATATFAGSTILSQLLNSVTPAEGFFLPTQLTWLSPSSGTLIGQSLIIHLAGSIFGGGPVAQTQTHFDQVSLDATATPEPGTFALLGTALLGLWGVPQVRARRQRRKQQA